LSRDKWPVNYQNPMELNRYGYTANNPANYTDASGNAALSENSIKFSIKFSIYNHSLVTVGSAVVVNLIATTLLVALLIPNKDVFCFNEVSRFGCRLYLDNQKVKILGIAFGASAALVPLFVALMGVMIPGWGLLLIPTVGVLEAELIILAATMAKIGELNQCVDLIITPFLPLFIPRAVSCF
jgi:hypothetical protein